MPSTHLFVNLGSPVRLHDSAPGARPVVLTDGWFSGLWTRRYVIEFGTDVRLVGVHFKPWGMSPFIDVPSLELRDQWLPVDAVWPRSLDRLRDRIAGATSTANCLQVLEDHLRIRLSPTPPNGLALVNNTAGRLASTWGAVPIGQMVDRAGVSATQLAKQFTRHVGTTPKRVARIYRFARLILAIDARGSVDWSRLAHAAGYFDQAHFGKEFKEFTGYTPTDYLVLRRRFPVRPGFPPDNGPMPAA